MKPITVLLFILASASITACKKDSQSTVLRVKLTDAPATYEQVNIDLKEININLSGDSSSWISVPANPGIYNLLALQNGLDTLIAEGTFPAGTVKEIRLVLGQNNTIKADGTLYDLTVPSGSESGLKIKLNKTLQAPIDSVTIDFDAALSVTHEAGGFKLRPVIRVVE